MLAAKPFSLHPSDAPLTVPKAPRFATDERAPARGAFDAAMAEKLAALEVSRFV